jgi:hypothetical protein
MGVNRIPQARQEILSGKATPAQLDEPPARSTPALSAPSQPHYVVPRSAAAWPVRTHRL